MAAINPMDLARISQEILQALDDPSKRSELTQRLAATGVAPAQLTDIANQGAALPVNPQQTQAGPTVQQTQDGLLPAVPQPRPDRPEASQPKDIGSLMQGLAGVQQIQQPQGVTPGTPRVSTSPGMGSSPLLQLILQQLMRGQQQQTQQPPTLGQLIAG